MPHDKLPSKFETIEGTSGNVNEETQKLKISRFIPKSYNINNKNNYYIIITLFIISSLITLFFFFFFLINLLLVYS